MISSVHSWIRRFSSRLKSVLVAAGLARYARPLSLSLSTNDTHPPMTPRSGETWKQSSLLRVYPGAFYPWNISRWLPTEASQEVLLQDARSTFTSSFWCKGAATLLSAPSRCQDSVPRLSGMSPAIQQRNLISAASIHDFFFILTRLTHIFSDYSVEKE